MEEDEEEGKMSYVVNGSKTTLLGSWDEENIAQLLATAEKHRRGGHGGDGAEAAAESEEDVKQPGENGEDDDDDSPCWHWQNLPESQAYSLYLLRWETELQLELGHSISSMIRSLGASAVQDVLSVTVLTTLAVAAFWPVLLLQLTSIIDNLWTIAVERADLAGKELARALLNREHGSRPVTLVGYSMGARVIFSCLRELAHQLHQDINFYEEEVEPVPGSVDASAEDGECAVQPNANADDSDELTLSGINESSAVPTAKEEASTPRTYTSSISNAGSSLFRMVRNTTSSIASTTSNVVSSAASTASSAFTSSSSDASRQAADGKVKSATDSPNPQKNALRGLIEHVVLLGAPVSHKSRVWGAARELVSGRIINGYSTRDMVLAVVYRYQRFQMAVSGVSPVEGEGAEGIENIDLSDIVEKVSCCLKRMHVYSVVVLYANECWFLMQHTDYGQKLPQILREIDLLGLRKSADLRVLSTMTTSETEEIRGTVEL